MKYFFLLLPIILLSCNSGPKPLNLKNAKPGKLEFFETYNMSEIRPSWNAACDWLKAHDSLALNGKVSLSDMDSRNLLGLVHEFYDRIGYVNEQDIAKVNELLAIPEVKAHFPKDLKFLWSYRPEEVENGHKAYVLYAVKIPDGNKAPIDGRHIENVETGTSEFNEMPIITITMNDQGAHDWELMTRKNIGRSIAIAFNDMVISAPVVQNAIVGGKTEISGNFTEAESEELAACIYMGRK